MMPDPRSAILAQVKKLPWGDRNRAMRYINNPIRILGGCLKCGKGKLPIETSSEKGEVVGLYIPQNDLVPQFVIYRFCPEHSDSPERYDRTIIERLIIIASHERPHEFFVQLPE